MATTKEAIAIVLDVGPRMLGPDLQRSLNSLNMIIQRKIFSESKDELALIVCGSDTTNNKLGYENIEVPSDMGLVSWDLLDIVTNMKSGSASGDFVDAIVVAMDVINDSVKGKRFANKRIILFSNFGGAFSDDQLNTIMNGMKGVGFVLDVIGPDLEDDADENVDDDNQDNKSKVFLKNSKAGEQVAKKLINFSGGSSFTFDEVDKILSHYVSRSIRSTPWKVNLEISSVCKIPVCKYIKIQEVKPKSWRKSYAKDKTAGIIRERSYHNTDENETAVEEANTVKAYRYGSSLIPFTEDDKNQFSYKSGGKCLTVLGFTKLERIKQHHFLGNGISYVIANKDYEVGVCALSAIIQALLETKMAAVARYVYSERSSPSIVALIPVIKGNLEFFIYVQLPFAEDLRLYTFAPLDIVSKNIPTEEQLKVVDKLITDLDLDDSSEDDNAKSVQNPYIQRLFQTCLQKLSSPDMPISKCIKEENRFNVSEKAVPDSKSFFEKFKKLFGIQMIEKKKRDRVAAASMFESKDNIGEPEAKIPKLDGNLQGGIAEVRDGQPTSVGSLRPSEDFLALLNSGSCDFNTACKQLQSVVLQLLISSFGDMMKENYDKAIKSLAVYRKEAIKKDNFKDFNVFMKEVKEIALTKSKKEFWEKLKGENIKLISSDECSNSTITPNESIEFFTQLPEKQTENPVEEEDADDLLDML